MRQIRGPRGTNGHTLRLEDGEDQVPRSPMKLASEFKVTVPDVDQTGMDTLGDCL